MPENNEMSRVKNKNAQKQQKHKNKKGKQHKNKSVWKILLFGFLFLIVAAIIGGAGLFAYYASSAPELTDKDLTDIVSKDLVDADGNVFYTLGAEERDPVKTENIPQVLADAIVSVEDQRFYKHSGVDPIGITRAAVGYVTNKGRIVGGGSTITQQLVKLSVFSTKSEDKNIKRKAQEAWLALKLERKLSKQQILTLYINKVYMAENQYGMGTAAEHYYGKDISELNVAEAALLAGMPKAPNSYNPRSNPEQATKRRNTVLQLMYEEKTISKEELDNAKETSIQDGLVELEDEQETNNLVYDAYVSQVLDEIKEKTDLDPYTSNIKTIYTNLDLDAQNQVYSVLNSDDYSIFPNDDMQAAVSVVDVNTGQLKAIGGGRKQDSLRALNRAQARTEIGSTVKPLGTYGPAIEHLKLSTYEQVIDSPTTYKSGQKIHNYDNKYEGQISMRRALVNSRNVPTYKINQQIDKSDIQDFLHNLGIQSLNGDPDDTAFHESNAFNGALSMIDLSAAYASFANGGEYTEPYAVSKIVLQTGEETDLTPQSHKAMSDYTAYMITDMLKDVAETGTTGRLVNIPGVAQAGKTGTPNYRSEDKEKYNIPKDAVPATAYVGYTTNYSISVWAGYDKRFEQGHWLASGDNTRQIPRNIYQSIMSHLSQSVKNDDWTMPDSVVPLKVVRGSMPVVLANSGTPSSQTVTELFVKGAEPKQSSSSSYGQKMPSPTGLSASYDQSADQVHIKWNNYSFNGSTGSASYRLKVGNRTYSTDSNSYVIKNPAKGNLTISLAAIVQGQTSPATSTTVTISSSENKEESSESSSEEAEESSESSSEEAKESSESSSKEAKESSESSSKEMKESNENHSEKKHKNSEKPKDSSKKEKPKEENKDDTNDED